MSNTNDKALKFQKDLIMVRDFLDNLSKQIIVAEEELKNKDKETQDLLHFMELKGFSVSEGYKIARDMKIVRQERRELKDLLEVMTVTKSKLNGNFEKINLLNEAIGEVRKINKNKTTRRYTPRVRVDLQDLFYKK